MSDTSEKKIALSKLPSGSDILVGRESELALLNESLTSESIHVVSIVAWGGTGKSALADHWMNGLVAKNWPGIDRYFDWSFYSQGTRGEQGTSADLFIAEALKFFGDPDPQAGSSHDRGERLAKLAAEHRTLLILDGLEPMQFGPGPQEGQLKDPALRSLLRSIAQRPFDGLCVLATREPVKDLERFHGSTVIEKKLENLSPLAGAKLLHHRGVDHAGAGKVAADDKELLTAVEEVAGHALTLQLMGNYLHRAHGGDIRRKDRFGFEPAMKNVKDYHAFRAIAVYDRWLSGKLEFNDAPEQHEQQYDPEQGERMLAVLRMLGLFDRPARPDCLDALRQKPVILGLNEPLVDLTDEEWNSVLSDLKKLELVELEDSDKPPAKTVDAHPLIREYFARQLRSGADNSGEPLGVSPRVEPHHDPETPEGSRPSARLESGDSEPPSAWTEGHRRLFEHLCDKTEHRPATVDGLQPLYQAVAHGCHAGLHQQACIDVYIDRILRGTGADGNYSTFQLGVIAADLGAVACFFEHPWSRLSPHLAPAAQAWLLNEAAYNLRALGRLTEAVEPMQATLEMLIEQEVWKSAAVSAGNLSELELTLGEVSAAIADAAQSVTFADRSQDAFQRMVNRTTHADALHQAPESRSTLRVEHSGTALRAVSQANDTECRATMARRLFAEAEAMQAERQPKYPRLHSTAGFKYCDLLLSDVERGAWRVILARPAAGRASVSTAPSVVGLESEHPDVGGRTDQPVRSETEPAAAADACDHVTERATQTVQIAERNNWLLDIALDHLTLGRAALYRAILSPDCDENRLDFALSHVSAAVTGLRTSGESTWFPLGLLTSSWALALQGDWPAALSDLEEAWEIAERGPMPLYQADILLTWSRLRMFAAPDSAADQEKDQPHKSFGTIHSALTEARRLIKKQVHRGIVCAGGEVVVMAV